MKNEKHKFQTHELGDITGIHVFDDPRVYWTDAALDAGPEGDRNALAQELDVPIEDILMINTKNHTNEIVVVDSIDAITPYAEATNTDPAVKSARKVLNWTVPMEPPLNNPSLGAEVASYDGVILVGAELGDKMILVTGADCTPVGVRGFLRSGEPFVAAIHAGRKGTMTGVIENFSKRLQFLGADVDSIQVYIGPAAQDIEVPLELLESESPDDNSWRSYVSDQYESGGVKKVRYNNQLDTTRRVIEQLGIDPSHVHIVDIDTEKDTRTHSFRREKTVARNSLIIGMNLAHE